MPALSGPAEAEAAPDAALGGLAQGYEHYLEKRGEAFAADWARTTVVLDTNVLLTLYRSPDGTREELLGALEAIAPSLFMPAQVQREFWRNRDSVLRENAALDEVANELRRMLRDAKKSLTRLGQGKIGAARAEDLIDRLEATLEEVIKAASSHQPLFNWRTALSASEQDSVLTQLSRLYDGRVGPEYGLAEFAAAIAEAASRFKRRIPPGYEDAHKSEHQEEGSGDYLLWRQTIEQARRSGRDVLIVTQDAKRTGGGSTPGTSRLTRALSSSTRCGARPAWESVWCSHPTSSGCSARRPTRLLASGQSIRSTSSLPPVRQEPLRPRFVWTGTGRWSPR